MGHAGNDSIRRGTWIRNVCTGEHQKHYKDRLGAVAQRERSCKAGLAVILMHAPHGVYIQARYKKCNLHVEDLTALNALM